MIARGKCRRCGRLVTASAKMHSKAARCPKCGTPTRVFVQDAPSGALSKSTRFAAGVVAFTAVLLFVQIIIVVATDKWLYPLEKAALSLVALFAVFLLAPVYLLIRKQLRIAQILSLVQAFMLFPLALMMFFAVGPTFKTFKGSRGFVPGLEAFTDVLLLFFIPFTWLCSLFIAFRSGTDRKQPDRRPQNDK